MANPHPSIAFQDSQMRKVGQQNLARISEQQQSRYDYDVISAFIDQSPEYLHMRGGHLSFSDDAKSITNTGTRTLQDKKHIYPKMTMHRDGSATFCSVNINVCHLPPQTPATPSQQHTPSTPHIRAVSQHACQRAKDLISRVQRGIEAGHTPSLLPSDMSSVYLMYDGRGDAAAIFKPTDEEPLAKHNIRGYISSRPRESGEPGWKPGIAVGQIAHREVAAFILDHESKARVPTTCLVTIQHPAFAYAPGTPPIPKLGSLQEFVQGAPDASNASEFGYKCYRKQEVHAIGILDIRTFNLDRHDGNFILKRVYQPPARRSLQERVMSLYPIDHGFCLPTQLEGAYWCWLTWGQAAQPFEQDMLDYIASLDADADVETLAREIPDIPQEAHRLLKLTTHVLKSCAARRWTLRQIAEIFSVPREGGELTAFEDMCVEARSVAEEWACQSWNGGKDWCPQTGADASLSTHSGSPSSRGTGGNVFQLDDVDTADVSTDTTGGGIGSVSSHWAASVQSPHTEDAPSTQHASSYPCQLDDDVSRLDSYPRSEHPGKASLGCSPGMTASHDVPGVPEDYPVMNGLPNKSYSRLAPSNTISTSFNHQHDSSSRSPTTAKFSQSSLHTGTTTSGFNTLGYQARLSGQTLTSDVHGTSSASPSIAATFALAQEHQIQTTGRQGGGGASPWPTSGAVPIFGNIGSAARGLAPFEKYPGREAGSNTTTATNTRKIQSALCLSNLSINDRESQLPHDMSDSDEDDDHEEGACNPFQSANHRLRGVPSGRRQLGAPHSFNDHGTKCSFLPRLPTVPSKHDVRGVQAAATSDQLGCALKTQKSAFPNDQFYRPGPGRYIATYKPSIAGAEDAEEGDAGIRVVEVLSGLDGRMWQEFLAAFHGELTLYFMEQEGGVPISKGLSKSLKL